MTADRAAAYATAMASLRDLQASKFTAEQMTLFVQAADACMFDARDVAEESLERAFAALDSFVDSDRLMPETVKRLKAELSAVADAQTPPAVTVS